MTAGGLHVIAIYPANKRRFLDSFFVLQQQPGSLRFIVEKVDLESQIEDFSFQDSSGKICKLRAEDITKDKLFKEWERVFHQKMYYINLRLYHNHLLSSLHSEVQKLRFHLLKMLSKPNQITFENTWSELYNSSIDYFKELRLKLYRCPLTRELPIAIQNDAEKYITSYFAEVWRRYQLADLTPYNTPLHYALEFQNEPLAILLAEHKPDYISIPNANGDISIDLALKYNFTAFIQTFEKAVSHREGIELLIGNFTGNPSSKTYKPLMTIYEYVYGKIPKASANAKALTPVTSPAKPPVKAPVKAPTDSNR